MHSHKGKVLLGSLIPGASAVSCVSAVSTTDIAAGRLQKSRKVTRLKVATVTGSNIPATPDQAVVAVNTVDADAINRPRGCSCASLPAQPGIIHATDR